MIQLKRAYDDIEDSDGFRVLVDRLWPRGVSKEKLQLDEWLKDIAPSNELRKWFGHDPDKFEEFKQKYRAELESKQEQINELKNFYQKYKRLTLIYAAKDRKHNNAIVLKEYLQELF